MRDDRGGSVGVVPWRKPVALLVVASAIVGGAMAIAKRPAAEVRAVEPGSADGHDGTSVVRALLERQMAGHATAGSDLWWSAIDLRYEEARRAAHELATAPQLPESSAGESGSATLPRRFSVLAAELRTRASAMEAAAAARDPSALAHAEGRVVESCVGCHAELQPRRR